jgi:hypothetical protein
VDSLATVGTGPTAVIVHKATPEFQDLVAVRRARDAQRGGASPGPGARVVDDVRAGHDEPFRQQDFRLFRK